MITYNPSQHYIKVQTWGTKEKQSNGIDNYIEDLAFGKNIGHASIIMTLPIDDKTKEWIQIYCYEQTFEEYKKELSKEEQEKLTFQTYLKNAKQRIPTTQKEDITSLAKCNEGGAPKKTLEIASLSEYFQIEFSWWPKDKAPFNLSTLENDMLQEREAKHFEYSAKAKEYLQPEERKHTGYLGGQVMTYAPYSIIHQRNLSNNLVEQTSMYLQLQKIKEHLATKSLLIAKVKDLKNLQIEGSFALICKNIKLDTDKLVKSFFETNPKEANLNKFKQFLLEQIDQHMAHLNQQKKELIAELKKVRWGINMNEFVTKGVPSDHTVILPFLTNENRGLSPEAMLKKMHELTQPNAQAFDEVTKNCSKTSIEILTAGAEHDSLLKQSLSKLALGFFGTPQQVLANAQNAKAILNGDKKNTFFAKIAAINILERAMGKLISVIFNPDTSRLKTGLAAMALLAMMIIRVPSAVLKAFLNPSKSMENIIAVFSAVTKHSNSFWLKGLVALSSAVALTALAPFALLEHVIKHIATPFQQLAHWISKKSPQSLATQINSPLPSAHPKDPMNTRYYSAMAALANHKISRKINNNRVELSKSDNMPQDILADFDNALKNNPDKPIILNAKDFDKVHQYIREKNNPDLTNKFQQCCDESLNRANKLSPRTSTEVDQLIGEDAFLKVYL